MMLSDVITAPLSRKRKQNSVYIPLSCSDPIPITAGSLDYKRPRISRQALPGHSTTQSVPTQDTLNDAKDPLTIMAEANSGPFWRVQMPAEFRHFTLSIIKDFIASQPFLTALDPNVLNIEDFHFKRCKSQEEYQDRTVLERICFLYCCE